jgi:hypothetical protein
MTLTGPEPPIAGSPIFRQFRDVTPMRMLSVNLAGMGAAYCHDPLLVATAVVGSNQPGYPGEQYLAGPGSLTLTAWTPNVIDYYVDTSSPTVMVVNQNYDPGWKLARGVGEVSRRAGLLAVRLPKGRQRLELRYRGHLLVSGLVTSLLTLLAAIYLVRREYRLGRTCEGRA